MAPAHRRPAGRVQLATLKPRGNPTATGSATSVDPADVTIRLVETAGAPTEVALSTSVGSLSEAVSLDLLEEPADGDPLRLHGYQIATVGAGLHAQPVIDADGQRLAPDAEAAQPLYARYWLHNRGPARWAGCPPSRICIPRR